MDGRDPRQALARRLRSLREDRWPGMKVNQRQLAAALSGSGKSVSVPLVSSWENGQSVPPGSRLDDIATFYATRRSFDGKAGRPAELARAHRAGAVGPGRARDRTHPAAGEGSQYGQLQRGRLQRGRGIAESLSTGPFRFEVGQTITIVCAELPPAMLQAMPYTDPLDPDYIEMNRYSDLGSLVELHGHLRQPIRPARSTSGSHQLQEDDYTSHLVALGGLTGSGDEFRARLPSAPSQASQPGVRGRLRQRLFRSDGRRCRCGPALPTGRGRAQPEDSPRGRRPVRPGRQSLQPETYCDHLQRHVRPRHVRRRPGADRCPFRDRNGAYVQERLSGSTAFCLLTRVTVVDYNALTPDWTLPETRLFEWSKS